MIKPNKDMSFTDTLLLWGVLNQDYMPSIEEMVDIIIENIDSYEIDYQTFNISVKFVKLIEEITITVNVNREN